MLTEDEKRFVQYWKTNRDNKKKVMRQLSIGLPLATVLVVAIFVNLLSGWFARAEMEFHRESGSLVLVLLVAAAAIVVFVTVFSVRHRWDINEQKFRELIKKQDGSGSDSGPGGVK